MKTERGAGKGKGWWFVLLVSLAAELASPPVSALPANGSGWWNPAASTDTSLLDRKLLAMQQKVTLATAGVRAPGWRRGDGLLALGGGGLPRSLTLTGIFEDMKNGRIRETSEDGEEDEAAGDSDGACGVEGGSPATQKTAGTGRGAGQSSTAGNNAVAGGAGQKGQKNQKNSAWPGGGSSSEVFLDAHWGIRPREGDSTAATPTPLNQTTPTTQTSPVNQVAKETAVKPCKTFNPKLGSLEAGLTGGQFTKYGLSRFGLDLSGSMGDLGLMLLFNKDAGAATPVGAGTGSRSTGAGRDAAFAGSDRLNQRPQSLLPTGASGGFAGGLGGGGFASNPENSPTALQPPASGLQPQWAGDYRLEGLRLNTRAGGLHLEVLDFGHETPRKTKSFFGNNSNGPYALGVGALFPGSEKVFVNGKELSPGTFDLDHTKGEIRFDTALSTQDRVNVEYAVLASQQDEPGHFTGLRVSGPVLGEQLGFSHLTQEVVGFERTPDGQVLRRPAQQKVMGVDGAFQFGKHEISLDVATSQGDRKRATGVLATAVFNLSDTLALDDNTGGPYQLSASALPVVAGSAQVLVDGFLVPSSQYTLDADQGTLTFQKNAIRFTGTEKIEVRYRYQPDVAATQTRTSTGQASHLGLKGEVGRLRYHVEKDQSDALFFTFGGSGGGEASSEKRGAEITLGKDHTLKLEQSHGSKLVDETKGLHQTSTNRDLNWSLKRSRYSLAWTDKQSATGGGQPGHQNQRAFTGALEGGDKWRLGLDWKESDALAGGRAQRSSNWAINTQATLSAKLKTALTFGQDDQTEASATGSTRKGGRHYTFTADATPRQGLTLHAQQGQNPATGSTRELKAGWLAQGGKLKVDFDRKDGQSPALGAGLSQSAPLGSRQNQQNMQAQWTPRKGLTLQLKRDQQQQRQPGGDTHGQQNSQWVMNYSPRQSLTFTTMMQSRDQHTPQGSDHSDITSLQSRAVVHRWDLAWTGTLVAQTRPGQAVDSTQWNLTVKAPRQRFIRNLRAQVKLGGQTTTANVAVGAALSGSQATSDQDGATLEWKVEAEPFWKDFPLSVTWLTRQNTTQSGLITGGAGGGSAPGAGLNPGNASTSSSGQKTLRLLTEVPFLGESRLELTWETSTQQQAAGNVPSNALEVLLKGNLSQTWQLKGGYRKRTQGLSTGAASTVASGSTTPAASSNSPASQTEEQWSLEGSVAW